MSSTKASFVWSAEIGGTKRHKYRTTIDGGISTISNIYAFGITFNGYSKCRLDTYHWTRSGLVDGRDGAGNADRKMVVFLSHPDNGVVQFSYPDPVDADVEATSQGKRMKAASLATLVGHINLFTGQTYTGLYGYVVESR
jgi:hypothetical protein